MVKTKKKLQSLIFDKKTFKNKTLVKTWIKNNNFKGNILHAQFDDSLFNTWEGNYWGRSRLFPKFIFGMLCIIPPDLYSEGLYIPWVNIDWNPAKEPYDIT